MNTQKMYTRVHELYNACETHGDIVEWIYKALLYEQTLREIDEMLQGNLPITAEIKSIIKKVLE